MFKIIMKIVAFLGLSLGLYAGNGLDQSHLLSVSPSASESGVSPDVYIEVKFDLPIKAKSLKKHTIVLKQNNRKVQGLTTLVGEDTLRFTPNETLEEGDYKVKVKKVKLQKEKSNDNVQYEPKNGFQRFAYWLCSLFYDNPADCPLCKKICGNSNNTIKTKKIKYTFTVEDNSSKIVKIVLSETSIELNEGNETTVSVTAKYDDNSTQDISSDVEWVIQNNSIATIDDNILKALKEGTTSLQVKYKGKASAIVNIIVYKEINSYKLPPEPDQAVNNATLLGIDSNDNGIRDDVERYIIIRYAQDPKYPKTKTAIALQYAWASQKIIENPTMESKKYIDDALDCQYYWFHTKQKNMTEQMIKVADSNQSAFWELKIQRSQWKKEHEVFNDPETKDKIYNTRERIKQKFSFNAALSGNIFDGRDESIDNCRTNIDEIGE